MNRKRPLTPTERTLILRENARGASIAVIRLCLIDAGFRRGANFISEFLRSTGHQANFVMGRQARPAPLLDTYQCAFCDWTGPHSDYYSHWRIHHRTRAGFSRGELRRA